MGSIPLKILVADDVAANLVVVKAVATRLGHTVVTASDGREAVCRYQEENPDLVFMDVMMPEMDGLAAVREIRALPSERWVPVVFYSALDHMDDVIKGLESGGDDYLFKPADLRVLRAKINGYAHAISLQRELMNYAEELAAWRADAEEQTRLGSHIMARLTDTEGLRDAMLRHFNRPTSEFSGDLLCATRGPGEVLYVMLADATGHGLPAALSAMPLTQIFYGMAAKGFSIASITEELNRKIKRLMPADRFVAATLATIDVRNQTIEVWNGGNPDALFINEAGEVTMRWASHHPPLGILPDALFSGETHSMRIQEPTDLLICSDGLVDAEAPDGRHFTQESIIELLGREVREQRFNRLVAGLEEHLAGRAAHDDVSFMMVNVPVERRHTVRSATAAPTCQAPVSEWRLALSYGPVELRYLDVVPAILEILTRIQALAPHQGALFLMLSELFNNALDHGLLGLESRTKELDGGFELYLEQRAARLDALMEGSIELNFHVHMLDGQSVLDMRVKDSGQGFDYSIYQVETDAAHERPHGRGIALLRSLCKELVYSGCGNEVRARYAL